MTATPTRFVDPSERSSALPRRAATVGALLAALGGATARASASEELDDLDGYTPQAPGRGRAALPADRHLVSRFSYGITPRLARDVRRAGGAQRWFERQLNPKAIKNDKATEKIRRWWPSLNRTPAVNRAGDGNGLHYAGDSAAIAPLGETLVEADEREQVVFGDVDPDVVKKLRARFPALEDRRPEAYRR